MQEEKTWKRERLGIHLKFTSWAVYNPEIWVSWKNISAFSGIQEKEPEQKPPRASPYLLSPALCLFSGGTFLFSPSPPVLATAQLLRWFDSNDAVFHHWQGLCLQTQICKQTWPQILMNSIEQHQQHATESSIQVTLNGFSTRSMGKRREQRRYLNRKPTKVPLKQFLLTPWARYSLGKIDHKTH